MSQYLFSTPNLNEYRNNPKIRASLNGVQLLNLEEFKNEVFRISIALRRSARISKAKTESVVAAEEEEEKEELKKLSLAAVVKVLARDLCKNMINEGYIHQSLLQALNSVPTAAEAAQREAAEEEEAARRAAGEAAQREAAEEEEEEAVEAARRAAEEAAQEEEEYATEEEKAAEAAEKAAEAAEKDAEAAEGREERVNAKVAAAERQQLLEHKVDTVPANFDLLIAFAPGFRDDFEDIDVRGITGRIARMLSKVVGFIIVQLGECKTHPDAYAVNLICTRTLVDRNDGNKTTIKGALLLGAYLFCIKQFDGVEQVGILELAAGYSNFAGFTSYTKMGFDKDISLSVQRCFSDTGNLAMSVNLLGLTQQQIIDLAIGDLRRNRGSVTDDTKTYGLVPENSYQIELQKKMADYANLKYKFQVAWYRATNGTESSTTLMDKFLYNPTKRGLFSQRELKILTQLHDHIPKIEISPGAMESYIEILQDYINTLILTFNSAEIRNPTGRTLRSYRHNRRLAYKRVKDAEGVANMTREAAAREEERLRQEQEAVAREAEHLRQEQEAAREEERLRQEQAAVPMGEEEEARGYDFFPFNVFSNPRKRKANFEGGKTKRNKKIKRRKTVKRTKTIKRKTVKRNKRIKKRKTIKRRKGKRTNKSKKNIK